MSALLTSESGNTDEIVKYINECKEMGIRVLPPEVNQSDLKVPRHGQPFPREFALSRIGLVVALFVVAFLPPLAYSTLHGPRYRVEVCMTFNGQTVCKRVNAKSENAAVRLSSYSEKRHIEC